MEGAVFYSGEDFSVFYDELQLQPFRVADNFKSEGKPFDMNFSNIQNWEIQRTWEDDLDVNNVICWVSDEDKNSKKIIAIIVSGGIGAYLDVDDTLWHFAMPIQPHELTSKKW